MHPTRDGISELQLIFLIQARDKEGATCPRRAARGDGFVRLFLKKKSTNNVSDRAGTTSKDTQGSFSSVLRAIIL